LPAHVDTVQTVPEKSPDLLTSQKNEILEALQELEVDPREFRWEWTRSWYSNRPAPILRQRNGRFCFLVDFRKSAVALQYVPSQDRPLLRTA
jgi:hypothetical protein